MLYIFLSESDLYLFFWNSQEIFYMDSFVQHISHFPHFLHFQYYSFKISILLFIKNPVISQNSSAYC